MLDKRTVIQHERILVSRHQQFLGRNRNDAHLTGIVRYLDFYVIDHRHLRRAHRNGYGHARVLLRERVGARRLRHNLYIRLRQNVHLNLLKRQALLTLALLLDLLLPIPFHRAILHQQRVLEARVSIEKARILLPLNVITGIGRLLCALHVLDAGRLELNGFVR